MILGKPKQVVWSSCTNLDHIYPSPAGMLPPPFGTKCFCGKRTWEWGDPNKKKYERPRAKVPLKKKTSRVKIPFITKRTT